MYRMPNTVRAVFLASTLFPHLFIGIAAPAHADSRANEEIRRQQKEECERQGGRYDFPKCFLPKERGSAGGSSCGWMCKLAIGVVVGGAAAVTYCKTNPDKC